MEAIDKALWRYRLRKTPFRIFWRLLIYQFLLGLAWFLFALIFPDIFLENKIVIFIWVTLGEMTVSTVLFFQWFYEYYRIADMELVHRRGVFLTHEETHSLQEVAKLQTNQSIFGRIFDYGNVIIFYRFNKTPLRIDSISDIQVAFEFLNAEIKDASEENVRRLAGGQ